MDKFIICYGWLSQLDVIQATSLDAATMRATERSLRDGCLDDDLPDTTWAVPYTPELAEEYGLEQYVGAKVL
jgi:hypothetical protein